MGDGNRGNLSYADERVNAKFAAPLRATRKKQKAGQEARPAERDYESDGVIGRKSAGRKLVSTKKALQFCGMPPFNEKVCHEHSCNCLSFLHATFPYCV